jgi:predicted molibdopterin-dependent oxidoreductase YjgC
MGENPMMSDPNTNHVEEAFRNLDFLVAQDIFPSETALLAHVVLPAASSLEKEGSFTNSERRVQLLHPVLAPPGEALPDWRIISEIAKRFDEKMGVDRRSNYWEYDSTETLFDELASATPIYAGISHSRLVEEDLQWPCPEEGHTGTSILHVGGFARGKGKLTPLEARDPAEKIDVDFPLILTTGRVLYHYHSGTMTRRSKALHWREPQGYVEINAEDAANIGLQDGYAVVIESRRGQVRTRAKISDRVAVGTVFLAFHWREAPANVLTQDHTLDPIAKIPEYKVCAVKLTNPRAK